MNIVLIGPQGSGKTTQSNHIAKEFDLTPIHIGDLVRAEAAKDTPKAELIDHISNQKGKLLPDGIVIDLLLEHFKKVGFSDLVFDGFPRTINQYHALLDLLAAKQQTIDICIYLQISEDQTIHRAQDRGRLDDNPQVIAARLEEYDRTIALMLQEIEKDGRLITLDASTELSAVSQSITQLIQERFPKHEETHHHSEDSRKLFVVAHCQSDYNKKGIYTGRLDIELSPEGHQRCQLSAEILKHEQIDFAYRSSLTRTKQTLDHIAKHHPDLEIQIDDRLIERSNGELDGTDIKQYRQTITDSAEDFEAVYDVAPPGGETMIQVEERVLPALEEVVQKMLDTDKNAIIVSHDHAIRPIRRFFEDLSPEETMKLDHQRYQIFTYDVSPETLTSLSALIHSSTDSHSSD